MAIHSHHAKDAEGIILAHLLPLSLNFSFFIPKNLTAQNLVFKLHEEALAPPFQEGLSDKDEASLLHKPRKRTHAFPASTDSVPSTVLRALHILSH